MAKQIKPPYRNYEVNQQKILAAYKELAEEDVILPSYEQVADRSGLSLSTVKRHFANLNFDYVCKRERVHTPAVVAAIRNAAIGDGKTPGKARAQKLYAQIMEGYIEKKDHKQEIVGDLKVNADIQGELKVNIQRGIIRSKDDLATLQGLATVYKKAKAAEAAPGAEAEGGGSDQGDAEIFDELTKAALDSTAEINIDNLIVFK